MRRSLCLAAVVMALVGSPATLAGAANSSVPSCVVKITALRFHPARVHPGDSSVARVKARNCTRLAQNATLTWQGSFVGATPGIPPGCPAIDPLAQPVTFAPRGQFSADLGILVFSGCTATMLSETVRFTATDGTVLATKSAVLRIK